MMDGLIDGYEGTPYWFDKSVQLNEAVTVLKAELAELQEKIAALEEQVAAGEWRPVGGDPPDDEIEIRRRADGIYRATVGFYVAPPSPLVVSTEDGEFLCYWVEDDDWEWRPAPPQE